MSDGRTASRRRALIEVGRAWKRVMLDKDGKLHADARLILRDLFDKSGFLSSTQHFPGQPDMTVARSSRREIVVHILALIRKSEDEIAGARKPNAIEHEDRDVDMAMGLIGEIYDN